MTMTDDPELEALIKQAVAAYEGLNDNEKFEHRREQYISWTYGQLKLSGRNVTKESIAKQLDTMIASGDIKIRI